MHQDTCTTDHDHKNDGDGEDVTKMPAGIKFVMGIFVAFLGVEALRGPNAYIGELALLGSYYLMVPGIIASWRQWFVVTPRNRARRR
jgi:hypothetical protein